jgi:hypothetical protein
MVISWLGVVLLVGSVAVPALGGVLERRDAALVAELNRLSSFMPRGATLGTCEALATEWGLHGYMMRFFRASLDPGSWRDHRYYLRLKDPQCSAPPGCRPVAVTERFVLLDCEPHQE